MVCGIHHNHQLYQAKKRHKERNNLYKLCQIVMASRKSGPKSRSIVASNNDCSDCDRVTCATAPNYPPIIFVCNADSCCEITGHTELVNASMLASEQQHEQHEDNIEYPPLQPNVNCRVTSDQLSPQSIERVNVDADLIRSVDTCKNCLSQQDTQRTRSQASAKQHQQNNHDNQATSKHKQQRAKMSQQNKCKILSQTKHHLYHSMGPQQTRLKQRRVVSTGNKALACSFLNCANLSMLIIMIVLTSFGYQGKQTNSYSRSSHTHNVAATLLAEAASHSDQDYRNTGYSITKILNTFFERGYDKRVRPNYGGPPVEVNVTMRILSISSVSEVMMDFTADFYFRQTWVDPRLSFKRLVDINTLYVGAEVSKKIWLPDTFFGNEKLAYFHEATTPNVFLRIDHTGEVYRSIRLTVTSSCPMNLQYFPMDRQRCTIEAESYGYNVKDIIYRWARKDSAVERDKKISLPQFDITKTVQKYRLEELSSGTYSRLIAEIHFARRMGYYLIQIYIPSSLIVVISWVSFWLHRNASPARVQLGVTTVLTMTTLMSSTNAALPKISYVKSIDIFLGTCFIMVFAALLEYATVGYLGKRIAMRKQQAQHASAQAQARALAQIQAQAAGSQGDPFPEVIPSSPQFATNQNACQQSTNIGQVPTVFNQQQQQQQTTACTSTQSFAGTIPRSNQQKAQMFTSKATVAAAAAFLNLHNHNHHHHHHHHHQQQQSGQHNQQQQQQQQQHQRQQQLFNATTDSQQRLLNSTTPTTTTTNRQQMPNVAPPPPFRTIPNHFAPAIWNLRDRQLDTVFGLTPSSIDKYSRVVFPVCFVCFQLMYWIVYLHISAFLDKEEYQENK